MSDKSNEVTRPRTMTIVHIVRVKYLGPDRWAGEGNYFFTADEAATYMWARDRKDYLTIVNGRPLAQDAYNTVSELRNAVVALAEETCNQDQPLRSQRTARN